MFTPRKFKPVKPQKRRSWLISSHKIFNKYGLDLWPGVFALNMGYVAMGLVVYIFV